MTYFLKISAFFETVKYFKYEIMIYKEVPS